MKNALQNYLSHLLGGFIYLIISPLAYVIAILGFIMSLPKSLGQYIVETHSYLCHQVSDILEGEREPVEFIPPIYPSSDDTGTENN